MEKWAMIKNEQRERERENKEEQIHVSLWKLHPQRDTTTTTNNLYMYSTEQIINI